MTDTDNRDYARERFRDHDRRAEAMEAAAIGSGNQALKGLLLLNGGACIALLGFLAGTFEKANLTAQNIALLAALRFFGWGAAAAVLASVTAYLCNSAYARGLMSQKKAWEWPYVTDTASSRRHWTAGMALNWIAVLEGAVSLGAFMFGLYELNGIVY